MSLDIAECLWGRKGKQNHLSLRTTVVEQLIAAVKDITIFVLSLLPKCPINYVY